MALSYPWPIPPGFSNFPNWTGTAFQIGEKQVPLLSFACGSSGWTDELTTFHEDTAGEDHFIDRASRQHAVEEVKRHIRTEAPVILEVGCSSGFLLRDLRRTLPNAFLIGADYVRGPLDALHQSMPDIPLMQFDLVQCPLLSGTVDIVVLLNVLEHIENDTGAMEQVARILKPGGAVVIEVPAGPHLYDVYDKVLMHFRRYRSSGLRQLAQQSGLDVTHSSSLGALLYPGFWFVKKRNRRYLAAPEEVQKQVVARVIRKTGRNRLMEGVMWLEHRLRRIVPLPFGIRCLATCVKPAARAA